MTKGTYKRFKRTKKRARLLHCVQEAQFFRSDKIDCTRKKKFNARYRKNSRTSK